MKKLLLIILLLALPLQISWAAVSAYCQHESGKSASHFGHHSHEHKVQKNDDKKEGSFAKIDSDCIYCHLSHLNFFSFSVNASPVLSSHSHLTDYDYHVTSNFSKRPERPKWEFAA